MEGEYIVGIDVSSERSDVNTLIPFLEKLNDLELAKHIPADKDGVRIAELDEQTFKDKWWSHTPITDFWRVGAGTAKRLETLRIYTMGDIARYSLDRYHIGKLYKLLGKNAELLIDHAWGIEPTTIADVKAYRPENQSITSGQVLQEPCDYEHTRLIVWEMADMLSLDLVDNGLVTDQIVLTVGYDRESLADGHYQGEVVSDRYGRQVPKHAHGTQVKPLLDAFFAWLETLHVSGKSALAKAVAYALNEKPYLYTFLENGNVPIDNNRAENAIRPFAVGRKNWMHSNTANGAKASAALYSIVATAQANGLNTEKYLTELFSHPAGTILLPFTI